MLYHYPRHHPRIREVNDLAHHLAYRATSTPHWPRDLWRAAKKMQYTVATPGGGRAKGTGLSSPKGLIDKRLTY